MDTSSASSKRLTNISVAECLLDYLELEGVNHVFGIPGAAAMHILNELKNRRERFQYVICRHESGAAFLADGYYRSTGKLGVVLVTSGPGATNALTGTMNAQNGNSAVLTITGEVPEKFFGRGYLQEGVDAKLDIDAIYRNASQYSTVVTAPENFQTLFTQATARGPVSALPGRPRQRSRRRRRATLQNDPFPQRTEELSHGSPLLGLRPHQEGPGKTRRGGAAPDFPGQWLPPGPVR